jgi:hypothetical protein
VVYRGIHIRATLTDLTYIREFSIYKDVHKKSVRNSVFSWPKYNNKLQYKLIHNTFVPYKDVKRAESMSFTSHGRGKSQKNVWPTRIILLGLKRAIMKTTNQQQHTDHTSKSVSS